MDTKWTDELALATAVDIEQVVEQLSFLAIEIRKHQSSIREKNDVLYDGERMLDAAEADRVARSCGFVWAEELVEHLKRNKKIDRIESARILQNMSARLKAIKKEVEDFK